MTPEEAEALVKQQGYCTPQLYAAINGREWNGHTRFVWFGNVDIGYPIKYTAARGGSMPNPNSEAQRQPWIELGISETTYYRRKHANKKWSEAFAQLGITDTPINRATYNKLAKAAEVLGVTVAKLWTLHSHTLGPGKCTSSSSPFDGGDHHSDPPPLPTVDGRVVERCTCKGPCEACHTVHR